ncbi:HAD-IA family hydrolase [Cellulomonas sp. P22]|uniref:HAD-IA family hydrolase n=1 Tax=Cellulomonas sp. P22 TaxID=3373189 RepID=UPI0037A9F600
MTTRPLNAADRGMPPAYELAVAAVLLDMDGTLVDSTAVVEAVWGEFAATHGVDLEAVLRFSHGRRTIDTVTAFLPDPHQARDVAADIEADELVRLEGIIAIPGARDLLASLPDARVAVVTSAERELAVRRLTAVGLSCPTVLVAAEDVEAGKPSPDGFLRAAAALGVSAEDCAAFEDAEAGLQAARAAGAFTVVVGGYESPLTRDLRRVIDFRQVRARIEGHRVVLALP